jgi:cytochrome c oxidase subunit 2
MDTSATYFLPPGASTMAPEVDALFYFIVYGCIFFFAIVTFLLVFFSLRYRKRAGDAGPTYGKAHNTRLEIAWSIVPTIFVVIVFFWGFHVYMNLSVVPDDAIEVKVTGQRWFWTFDYPEGQSTVNELIVPVDRPVKLLMSSRDVIHSFFVPDFRIKRDVLPNRYTIIWFEATSTGDRQVFCTEYCGEGHSDMLGKVKVLSDREYRAWQEESSVLGEGMTPEEFGASLYQKKACITCHKIDGTRLTGPPLNGIFGHEVALADGRTVLVDENYIRKSILEPRADLVAGYEPVMPTYQGLLKDKELDALVAFIKSLK